MKLGLIADVRGLVEPLHAALALLAEEGCDRVACLGSTVEGGQDDDAVLEALVAVDATVLASPHDDVERLGRRAETLPLAGLELRHATPVEADDVLWVNGVAAPSLLRAREPLGAGSRIACGDLYAPVAWSMPAGAPLPRRRVFLGPDRVTVPDGGLLACPGSVALAGQSRYGGTVAAWDEERRELAVVPFDLSGRRLPSRRPLVFVYCTDFAPHLPDDEVLAGVEVVVRPSADAIRDDVDARTPDVIVLDYHLEGGLSGLDALLALREGRAALPAPVLTMAGNPADSQSMRAVGAVGGLPFVYLRDTFTRLLLEMTPGTL